MRFVLTAVVMLLTVVSALGREWKDSTDEKPVALTLVRDGQGNHPIYAPAPFMPPSASANRRRSDNSNPGKTGSPRRLPSSAITS